MKYFKHISTQNFFFKLFACIACEKSSKFAILRFCEFQLFRARCVHFFQNNLFCTPFWIHNFFFIPEYPVFYCIAQPEPNCTFGSDCLIIKHFFLILRTFWHIFQNSGQRVNFKIIFRSEFKIFFNGTDFILKLRCSSKKVYALHAKQYTQCTRK